MVDTRPKCVKISSVTRWNRRFEASEERIKNPHKNKAQK